MGAYLNKPIVEKEKVEGVGNGFKYACTSMQGWRANQEDAHNCVIDLHDGWHMFAVYDGHGGVEVSKYTAQKLPNFLKERKFWEEPEIEACMQKAFVDFDEFLRSDVAIKEMEKIVRVPKESVEVEEDETERSDTLKESTIPIADLIKRYGQGADAKSLFAAFLQKGGGGEDEEDEEDEDEAEDEATGDEEEEGSAESKTGPSDAGDQPESDSAEKKNSKKRTCKSPINTSAKKSKSEESKEETEKPAKEESKEEAKEESVEEDGEASKEAANALPTDVEGKSTTDTEEGAKPSSGEGSAKKADDEEEEDDKDFVAEEVEDEESIDDEDEEFENMMLAGGSENPGEDSGSTACVCLFGNNKFVVVNAGDSRAVLCRAGKAIDLSVDHKPEDEIETTRIHKAGGVIEDGRVNGGLNLSRAFGDHAYKKNVDFALKDQMITAHPDVKIEGFTAEDEFLIVACDGIWNSMESQQVIDFVRKRLQEGKTCAEVCDALCDECLADSTDGDGTGCDNMTVICTQFVR